MWLACVPALTKAHGQQPEFQGIGAHGANGISGDGSVVVGQKFDRPIRWTRSSGLEEIAMLPGSTLGHATAVSSDGNTIVGFCGFVPGPEQGFVWRSVGGAAALGTLTGFPRTIPRAVSGDGSVIVGQALNAVESRAFRWTEANGFQELAVGVHSDARAVSDDGRVVTGWVAYPFRPFRWTANTGMQALSFGSLCTCGDSEAIAISRDSSTIVGVGHFCIAGVCQYLGFRTRDELSMTLPWLSGNTPYNVPRAISGNGAVVVGHATTHYGGGSYGPEALIWDEHHDLRQIREYLLSQQVASVTGWILQEPHAVSADGTVIAGSGRNPNGQNEAWIAVVPRPPCIANCDRSLVYPAVNPNDFICFLAAFVSGNSAANCDGNTTPPILTANDFACFLNAYIAGCTA
jgi:uncharacterized membrane protein